MILLTTSSSFFSQLQVFVSLNGDFSILDFRNTLIAIRLIETGRNQESR
jgi:hypothetical protein